MGKYEAYSRITRATQSERKIHPVWRGMGFLFMFLIPLMAYAATMVLIESGKVTNFLAGMRAGPGDFLYYGDPDIYGKIVITLAFVFIFYAIFTFITFAINGMFGYTRYGPYDMPPVSRPKRRRR